MNYREEIKVLRELAKVKLELAREVRNEASAKLWTQVNDLKAKRPAVIIYQVPWHEMNVNDELTLLCEDPFHKNAEWLLRKEIYAYRHFPGNMVTTSTWNSDIVIKDSGFGIEEASEIVTLDRATTAPSRHFHVQMSGMEDIDKMVDPIISIDEEKTAENLLRNQEIFEDILAVEKVAKKGY